MEVALHCYLLLGASIPESLRGDSEVSQLFSDISDGNSYKVVNRLITDDGADLASGAIEASGTQSSSESLMARLNLHLKTKFPEHTANRTLLLTIALLQTFIQNNYTGPAVPVALLERLYSKCDLGSVRGQFVQSLTVHGQSAYELMDNPECLVIALLLLEQLTRQPSLLFEVQAHENSPLPVISKSETPALVAVAHWWRARALLAHISVLPEPSGHQPNVAAAILESIDIVHAIVKDLDAEFVTDEFKKKLYTIYYLENVKCSLAIQTEHLCLPSLIKAKKLTGLQFVLTGARAKRTKFQQATHSGLIILAKSALTNDTEQTANEDTFTQETFSLNSDVLLEKPQFESIGSEPLDEQIFKKQKLDLNTTLEEDKLLCVAQLQENIPAELKDLDPNEQPELFAYDTIQLLLRLYTIRQTTPAKDALVEEELGALIARIIYQSGGFKKENWTITSRAFWERSILEINKAKTVERGLLQMQALVEELDLKIKTRMLPQVSTDNDVGAIVRLKFIHQLPFIARWELDATLAEKYMSLGVLKSAVEIYERLHMWCEAALCYAAVGEEKTAESILLKRIEENDKDARALSILGDIRRDPELWERSWQIGKYVNAKNSLARYYYNPPQESGLKRDYDLVLKHLNDSLRQYSLNFETWYFYGCVALECERMKVAAEAFSRCVSLDDTHAMAWSNLSAAYVQLGKLKEAFSCLKKAVTSDSQRNWRIWENYLLVSFRLREWDDTLVACKHLITLKRDSFEDGSIDLPVIKELVEILVTSDYPRGDNVDESQLSYFQRNCIEFTCVTMPSVITNNASAWRLVARVELWRRRPWAALECHERAYRAVSQNPDIEVKETAWDDAVDACDDLVAAYESLGEMEGKYGSGSVVCKDWKYKARSAVKALMSKGKGRWDGSDGWDRLLELRKQI
ncbi:tetratricopeptide repeat-containing protein EMW1 KNAG_0A01290 [Huiozyma naganishii CBS 8797]|uniref:Uncharacterized protein n=1 Tax=Huiozyma naganishii (strain ATCC MYA-139 / BCRC 22969 / CBS 8797 / KCTC 17520 / NBRC 10181 / NCYC 3082 / Yp74L-3) TaxID=1071383 RepID=J7RE32_HUIN7|nr:hypothetical protein KNAG_0A01290 [Kazachstania naganishii CBS 8797]CCK67818.1 hypothetical protein KNAG_0A01290 [Kazachstania naganishii CBS 8797]